MFYLISAVPNELCKNWSWRPSEHSILRIYNLKQDIEKETKHIKDKKKILRSTFIQDSPKFNTFSNLIACSQTFYFLFRKEKGEETISVCSVYKLVIFQRLGETDTPRESRSIPQVFAHLSPFSSTRLESKTLSPLALRTQHQSTQVGKQPGEN